MSRADGRRSKIVALPEDLPWSSDRQAAQRAYYRAYRAAGYGRDGQRSRDLLRKYGINEADYDRMREEQDYRCAICRTHEADLPQSRTGRPRVDGTPATPGPPLVVDHCHATGEVRGLLCNPCNHGLGHFKDDEGRLFSAARYLRRRRMTKPVQLTLDISDVS